VPQKRRRNEIFWVVASVSSAGLLTDRLSVGSPYSSVGVVPMTTPPPVEVNAAARADGRHPFRASFIVEVLRRPGEPGRFRSGIFVELLACNGLRGSMERLGHGVTMRRWNRSSRCCNAMSSTVAAGAAHHPQHASRSHPGPDIFPDQSIHPGHGSILSILRHSPSHVRTRTDRCPRGERSR
jgi:hypothetical protein